jgi:hypothetical protein
MGSTMIASLRNAFIALSFSALVGPVWAAGEVPKLRTDHPSRYIVQKGDSLWDISGRFLNEPWLWRGVWQANPQIDNPDLLFPGDEILLSYKDARPIIRVRRRTRHGVTQLSPAVRSENLATQAIPVIPIEAIAQFLARPRVVTEAEIDAAPYILSVGHESLIARPGSKIYVRGVKGNKTTRYSVYRKGNPYINSANGKELLGYEALHVADAVVDSFGDPVTLVLTRTFREVLVGDRLVEVDKGESLQNYLPHPIGDGINGQIISVVDGLSQIGQFHTVVLNLGVRDGLEPGHVFAVYQPGAVVRDPLAVDPQQKVYDSRAKIRTDEMDKVRNSPGAFVQGIGNAVEGVADLLAGEGRRMKQAVTGEQPWADVTLPEERAGTIMVYRSFERVSYALVMKAVRAIHLLDTVTKP